MLKARLPGILGAFPPLRRLYGRLPTRRRAPGVTATLLAAALLSTGLVTVLLGPSGSAQAQDSEPPTVPNLRCIAETERVAFLWDVPEWSGGEVDSYDYRLTLPEGRSEGGRLGGSITLVLRPGSYQSGKAAQFRITANYETDDGRDVSSAEATLTCYIGGARPLVIAPGNITRVYGGTDAMSYTVSGLVDGDAAVDVLSGRLGRAPGDDVGSYAIDLGTLGLTPAYATKYALPDSPTVATYTITPRAAAYTGTVTTKAYDGTTTVQGALSGGFAAGDIVSGDAVTVSGGSYAAADAGTGVAITGVSAGGADAGNYSVTFNVSGDITPREITATNGVRVNARLADGTTGATFDTGKARGIGVLPGQLSHFRAGGLVVSGTFPSAEAGAYDLSVAYSLQDHGVFKAGNYMLSSSAASATLRGEIQDASAQSSVPTPQAETSDGRELLLPPCEPDADATPAAQDATIAFLVCDDDLTIESVATGPGITFYPNFSPHRHNYLVHVPDNVEEVKVVGKFKPPVRFADLHKQWKVPGFAWAFANGEFVSNPDLPASYGPFAEITAKNSTTSPNRTLNVSLSPGVITIRIGAGQWFQRMGPSEAEANDPSYPEYYYRSAKTARKTYTLHLVWKSPGTTLEAPDEPARPARSEDYDADDDGLIEVSNLAQLDAIRWDLDGDGYSDHGGPLHQGYPNAMPGMGCPSSGCLGYELAGDLDFDTNENGIADSGDDYWNGGHGWLPIGMDSRPFRAVFEGNGRVISNLHISSTPDKQSAASGYTQGIHDIFFQAAHIGLFEEIGAGGVVRNVGLAEVDVSRTFTCQLPSSNHCAHEYVGALAGSTSGRISGSWATGVVSHNITRAWEWGYGALSAAVTAGGLAGYAHSSSLIANSYSTAAVSVHSDGSDLGTKGGGLVGHNDGSIIATYATGSVHTSNWAPDKSFYPYKPAYRTGGLVGHNRGPVTASYSTGRVSGGPGAYGRTGLVGWDEGDAYDGPNYFDTNTSGQSRSPFGRGKTTAELQAPTGYAGIYASWNVDLNGDGNGDDPWDFGTSRQYPVLSSLGAAKQRARMPSTADKAYSITANASVLEGKSATLTITLSEAAPEDGVGFTVTPSYNGRATATAEDVGSLTSPVTVTQGNTTLDITIPTASDFVDENDETFTVTIAPNIGGWGKEADGKDTATVTITDDDTAGVTVSAPSPLTVAEGGSATYTVVLDSQPTAEVTVTPTSGDADAASVSPASHIFTPLAWNTSATFTVSGVADADTDDESVGISHLATSDDGKYDGIVVATVAVGVSDNTSPPQQQQTAPEPSDQYADLIAKMKEWRNDPRYVSDKAHTDRWDRTLLAFGETVADTSLTPMTADEAQGFADRGWTRWTEVAEALRELENWPPTVSSAIADATIVNGSGTRQVSLSGVFDDADNDVLTVTAASSDEAVATVSVAAGYATLTVSAHSRGIATITVTANDGNGGTVSDTFTVTVKAAPVVASAISDLTGLEVAATQEVSLSGVFGDADGDALTFTAASSDDSIATVTVAGDQSKLTLAGVAQGTATITVTAQDSDGNRVSDAFDAPVAKNHAGLIAQMYQWRNDPRYVSDKDHTDRWDRTLLAFGETVSDTTLTPMTADEAQGYADRGWTRWTEVVTALREIEASGSG